MTADCKQGGIDIWDTSKAQDWSLVDGAVVVGRSTGNPGNDTMYKGSAGIMTSRYDKFKVNNVSFYNFGQPNNKKFAAIFVCSVCANVCERF